MRTVGGPWHDFEVEGVNYGPTEETYAEDRSLRHRKEHDRENSIGLGGWRIELSPKDNPVATNFLVVLQAADQTTESMVPVERIERDGSDRCQSHGGNDGLRGHLRYRWANERAHPCCAGRQGRAGPRLGSRSRGQLREVVRRPTLRSVDDSTGVSQLH